ncbi:MAG: hypothetical protein I8H86_01240 [Sphingomonadaceae bacterium]|nr:hypothetical protein [Sphingomonadaceae bacterium]
MPNREVPMPIDWTALATWKDLASIVAAFASPFIGAWSAGRTLKARDQARLHGYIDWETRFDEEGVIQYPFLALQNISSRNVLVTAIDLRSDFFFLQRAGIALRYDDPSDLPFPAEIEAGKMRVFALDEDRVLEVVEKKWRITAVPALLFKRPRIKIRVETLTGERLTLSAERAIEWRHRSWRFRP